VREAFKMATKYLLAFLIPSMMCSLAAFAAAASQPAAPTVGENQSQDEQIKKLIGQLTDESFSVRDAASAELLKIGPAALPALKEALKSEDPNVKSYAEYLVGRIENPRPAARASDRNNLRGFNGRGFNRGFGGNIVLVPGAQQRVAISVTDGVRRIDANEDGVHVVIDEGPNGIKMTVTESKDGKEVSSEFTAKNADELKAQNPNAWNYYQKYAAIDVPALRARVVVPRVHIQPLDPNAIDQDFRARQLQMRQRLEDAMRNSGVPEDEVRRALDRLDQLNRNRPGAQDH